MLNIYSGFHPLWLNQASRRRVTRSEYQEVLFCMSFRMLLPWLSYCRSSIDPLSWSIIFSCGSWSFWLLAFLALFDCLILCFEGFNEHVLNFLAMVKYWLKAMWQLKVGVENLAEDLWGSVLCYLILCLRLVRQEGIELVHELLDLDYDMMTCFSLLTG